MQNVVHIRRVHESVLAEVALALTALACEDVATICLLTLDCSRSSDLESLLRARICLHLRHYITPELIVVALLVGSQRLALVLFRSLLLLLMLALLWALVQLLHQTLALALSS